MKYCRKGSQVMNRKFIRAVLTAPFFLLIFLQTAIAQSPDSLRFDPLQFETPGPHTHRLSNAIPVYMLEDRELPLISVDVLVKTGKLYEPMEQVGLFGIMADVMRTGGTTSRTPESVDEELESMAASVDIRIGPEYGIASLDLLAEDLERGLDIFTDILHNPLFRRDRVELRKKQEIEGIRRRNDDPFDIALRFFPAYLYGRNHPLGAYADVSGILSIGPADLRRAHAALFHPDDLVISVTGDFEQEFILQTLERHFGDWNPKRGVLPSLPEPDIYDGARRVIYINKDLNQSTIVMGYTGMRRTPDNQDIYAIRVMNEILGESSFTSRLFREVRDKRGLAYSVGSYFDTASYAFPGYWFAFTQTMAEKTVETASIILDVIESMKREPVTDEELQLIKDSIINSFVFGFESSSSIVRQRMILDFRGYPEDYLENYTENIARVTSDDVLRVARGNLNLDHLIFVIVGNEEYFEEPLDKLGEVVRIHAEDKVP